MGSKEGKLHTNFIPTPTYVGIESDISDRPLLYVAHIGNYWVFSLFPLLYATWVFSLHFFYMLCVYSRTHGASSLKSGTTMEE